MSLNLKKKNYCLGCQKQISMQKAFCSNTCKDTHFENLRIQVPHLFVKKLIQHYRTPEDRKKEILKFAKIHNFDSILTQKKVNDLIKVQEKTK